MGDSTRTQEPGWRARPGSALALRAAALIVPIAAGVTSAVVVTRALPRPSGAAQLAVLWLIGAVVSTLVLIAVSRLLRRLLPLAALLELSLTFPDQTPSRLGVALRAGNLRSESKRHAAMATAKTGDGGVETVLALAAALSAHDRATRGHSERVRAYSELLCEEMRLPEADRARLRWASLLHDVGKMAVPASLLNKEGALTDDDWHTLRSHPEEGARLATSLSPWLGPWVAVIAQHHERWDGKGYPHGLAGTDIQQGARIVAVADAYEVMTANRAYKKPLPASEARSRLAADAGHQFDPHVVRAFLNLSMGRLRVAAGPVTWLAQVPFLRPAAAVARSGTASVALGGVLAASVVALALPPVASTPAGPAQTAAGRTRSVSDEPQSIELVVAAPPAADAAAADAPGSLDPDSQQPTPVAPPNLASEATTAPAASPTPPPGQSSPEPADPSPPVDQDPTPLVRVTVEAGAPVDEGLAVGVGDADALPIEPVDAELHLG